MWLEETPNLILHRWESIARSNQILKEKESIARSHQTLKEKESIARSNRTLKEKESTARSNQTLKEKEKKHFEAPKKPQTPLKIHCLPPILSLTAALC